MKQLFVLDPIENINPKKDSSAALMQAASRAQIDVWICTPSDLQARGDDAWVVSNKVNLAQPATSIKVLVAANRQPEADFRVYYRLYTADSSEVSQSYRPFPGHENLVDIDGDGFGDQIIDLGMSDGRPDAFVKANGQDDFSEYQFSIEDLEQFSGFSIKIVMTSTNECVPIRLKDFRAIALA